MKKAVIFIAIIFSQITAQEFVIEQLTDIEFEIKNPVFPQYEWNWPGIAYGFGYSDSELFFEVYKNEKFDSAKSNIAYLTFNYSARNYDEEIHYLTDNNFIQRNISATTFPNYMVIWETNKNGNWDIEYIIRDSDTTWSEPKILIRSDQDETNAKFVHLMERYYDYDHGYENKTWITYEKNHKIYLAEFEDSLKSIDLVFPDTTNFEYSNPTACLENSYNNDSKIYVAAERHKPGDAKKKIVMTDVKIKTKEWRDVAIISDSGNSYNPEFVQIGYFYDNPFVLSFEIKDHNRNSINILYDDDYYNDPYTSGFTEIRSDPNLDTFDYYAYMFFIVTKQIPVSDFESYFPNIFRAVRNDSTFVVFSSNNYWERERYVYVNNRSTEIAVGPVAPYPDAMLSYMVWTDETGNGINLFGAKRYDNLGAVEENEALKNRIVLSQNYPNPFNPSTTIKFTIPQDVKRETSNVKLIVYDILGREVKTLINKPMQPGNYEIEFDGSNLPSGVYFYRLTSGDFVQSMKMVLIK